MASLRARSVFPLRTSVHPSENRHSQLINSGLQRITELFRDLEDLSSTSSIRSLLHNVGEALHLICSILQPLRADPSGLPTLEPEVQDAFVDTVKSVTQKLEQQSIDKHVSDDVTDLVVIIARLWQFDLCLPGAWTRRLKENVSEVLVLIVKLAIVRVLFVIAVLLSILELIIYRNTVVA